MHEFDVISIWPDWEIVDLLGKGKYGEVYYARKVEGDEVFYSAIKVINLPYHTQLADKAVSLGMKQEHLWEYFRKFKMTSIGSLPFPKCSILPTSFR